MRPPYALFILLLAALSSAAPALAQPSSMTPWNNKSPLKIGTTFGGLKVVSVKPSPDPRWEMGMKAVTFVDGAGRRGKLAAVVAFDDVFATIGGGRIDPDSHKDQVLLADFSGGAHCCTHLQLLDWVGGAWRALDIGTFDGEPFDQLPVDVDGDGVIDIVHADDRFAYAFGCYACSWMPPRVFNVRKGKVIDVSAAPRYRKLFEEDYLEAKDACGQPTQTDSNAGYCAGVVADGMRLGLADEAWAFALSHLKLADGDALPGCKVKVKPKERCAPEDQYSGREGFRPALTQFLAGLGYRSTAR